MTNEEYLSHRSHLRSINPMTADAPPEDELQELEDRYVEQCTSELMEGLYDDPTRMLEYVLEASYENTALLELIHWLGLFIDDDTEVRIEQVRTNARKFFETTVAIEAQDYVREL